MSKQNLTLHEQMSEFVTTNGDLHIFPFLNKFEKLTLAQGKHSFFGTIFEIHFRKVHAVCWQKPLKLNRIAIFDRSSNQLTYKPFACSSLNELQRRSELSAAVLYDRDGDSGSRRASEDQLELAPVYQRHPQT